jgi:hypothetical protein
MEAVEVVNRRDRPYTMAMVRADASISSMAASGNLLQAVALEQVRLSYRKASLERKPDGLVVTTAPEFGAFAGSVTLGLDSSVKTGLGVHVRVRVLQGKVGFGILDSGNKAFLLERSLRPSPDVTELILPLPSPPVTGDLIIFNRALGNVISKAIIDRIEVRKAP